MKRLWIVVGCGLLLLTAGAVLGQSSVEKPGLLAAEMRGVREALDRLVALHEGERHDRQIDLVLKRIEVGVARLAPVERMVVTTEGSIERLERSLTNLDRMEAQAHERVELDKKDGVDDPRSEARMQIKDIRRSRLTQQERLEAQQSKLQQLENDLLDDRRTIEMLDDLLLELLEEGR